MYDVLIKKASNKSISDNFSNILLKMWGMNPEILISGKENVLQAIADTLSDVKNSVQKKREEML